MSELSIAPLFGLAAIASAIALVVYTFWLGGNGRGEGTSYGTEPTSRSHVRWGLFYVNADDPRGWVPKTSGFGITPNLRTEAHLRRYAGLIVVTLGSTIAMVAALLAAR